MATKKVFLLECSLPDGSVKLRRPSTSISTIMAATQYLMRSTSKDKWDFTLEITRVEMMSEEITAAIKLFDSTVQGEMAVAELSSDLHEAAVAAEVSGLEADYDADHQETPDGD